MLTKLSKTIINKRNFDEVSSPYSITTMYEQNIERLKIHFCFIDKKMDPSNVLIATWYLATITK